MVTIPNTPIIVNGGGRVKEFVSVFGLEANPWESKGATVTFNTDSCDGFESSTGRLSIIDNTVEPKIKIKAEVTTVVSCGIDIDTVAGNEELCQEFAPSLPCGFTFSLIQAKYETKDGGTGTLEACSLDSKVPGFAAGLEDGVGVLVLSGPYQGYSFIGAFDGNIVEKVCPEN